MKSKDVTALYGQLPVGAFVQVVPGGLPSVPKARAVYKVEAPPAPVEVGRPAPFVKSDRSTIAGQKSAAAEALRLARNNS